MITWNNLKMIEEIPEEALGDPCIAWNDSEIHGSNLWNTNYGTLLQLYHLGGRKDNGRLFFTQVNPPLPSTVTNNIGDE